MPFYSKCDNPHSIYQWSNLYIAVHNVPHYSFQHTVLVTQLQYYYLLLYCGCCCYSVCIVSLPDSCKLTTVYCCVNCCIHTQYVKCDRLGSLYYVQLSVFTIQYVNASAFLKVPYWSPQGPCWVAPPHLIEPNKHWCNCTWHLWVRFHCWYCTSVFVWGKGWTRFEGVVGGWFTSAVSVN